ncbi:MAG: hypothetical protein Q7R72_01285 [bacterium]|nr:hypothetical protein [bacterium]
MQKFNPENIAIYYKMNKGDLIENFNEYVYLGSDIFIRNKIVKYITDQRRIKDNMSAEDIKSMFKDIPDAVKNKEFDIENPNPSIKSPGSRLVGKFYPEKNKGLLVVKDKDGNIIDVSSPEIGEILNAFYRKSKEFNKLKND